MNNELDYSEIKESKVKAAMCLMAGKEEQLCSHKRCWEFANYPQYYSNTRQMVINQRTDFEWFRRQQRGKINYIVPVNPYHKGTPAHNDFKTFEKRTSLVMFGDWPTDWDLFHKSDIRIEFVQYAKFKFVFNKDDRRSVKKWTIDVKEAAIHTGYDHLIITAERS